jgi:cob(I)alamin adenosyltransferase
MVNLTKIYTRTGDDGTTALGDFSRTSKTDPRLQAYADCNEANAAIGIAIAAGGLGDEERATLLRVQNELFDVGADLCTPLQETYEYPPLRVAAPWIDDLERDCDQYLESLPKLDSFVLPGGTPGAALLHVARTVARRAERSTWALLAAEPDATNPVTATYLNRLSDLLFILARAANAQHGDVTWKPKASRS